MKSAIIIFTTFLYTFATLNPCSGLDVDELVTFAEKQYTALSDTIPPTGAFISTGDPFSPTWRTTNNGQWTAGFYAGSLWMLYKHTQNTKWRNLAVQNQEGLFKNQFDTSSHDIGFVMMSSYGLGLEFTETKNYENLIIQSANSLIGRFFRLGGVFRSWNNGNNDPHGDEVKVIVDNMMNLELMFKASELSGEDFYRRAAISHAHRTLIEHFRPDGGTYHVVTFYEATGTVKRKYTGQGYATESTWSRGHAWAIHGFTTTYEYTNDTRFLDIAEKAADYFISHLPSDFIPVWDFDAPVAAGYQPRDTAAATVATCAFFKLFAITNKQNYYDTAVNILESLVANYRADINPNHQIPAILVNGTVFFNANDFDTSITYGDFYFLQALDFYKRFQRK